MIPHGLAAASAFGVLVLVGVAHGDILVLNTTREVAVQTWGNVNGNFDGGAFRQISYNPGPFEHDFTSLGPLLSARAYQDSLVTAGQVTASGGIDFQQWGAPGGGFNHINLSARVTFEVSLWVTGPTDFVYTVTSTPVIGGVTYSGFETELLHTGTAQLVYTGPSGPFSGSFSGTLPQGIYRLRVFAQCGATLMNSQTVGTPDDWSFNCSLTAVPVPASACVLGLAAAAVLARRRRA